jgi:uncharacterized membrane protein
MWSLLSSGQQGPPDSRGLGQTLIPIAAVIAVLLIILIVILLFPRLRSVKNSKTLEPEVKKIEERKAEEKAHVESPLDITLRLLNDDEKRIVELLAKSGGAMLQKDLSYELKLSRVKTHRVLVGLIERGVVRAEKHFNTNMITLSDWLRGGESADSKDKS